ncbi:MAG: isochorismatase family cysteine hydrolase [Clostridia bacterium]|nr:isochorismatase family cysteine hydrolase [Clostridia bacterium]
MSRYLIVVDMQNDFITGALGSSEAQAIVPNVVEKVKNFGGRVVFTRDSHGSDYMDTEEGRNLPVMHCVEGTHGWEICDELKQYAGVVLNKPSFGARRLGEILAAAEYSEHIEEITFVGLCTDICVISNAMLVKAFVPESKIIVDASCCAGVSPESHKTALEAMKACQIEIINE